MPGGVASISYLSRSIVSRWRRIVVPAARTRQNGRMTRSRAALLLAAAPAPMAPCAAPVAKRRIVSGLGCLALLAGCATATGHRAHSASLFAQAVPICAILAHPEPYIGKRVLVRGEVTETPHGRDFLDEGCDRGDLPVNIGLSGGEGLLATLHRYSFQSERRPPEIPAVFSGVLTDHRPALYCHLICGDFSLDDARLEAVRRH